MSATNANARRLSPRERLFLSAVVRGETQTAAYLMIRPDVEPTAARVAACRMMRRILLKVDWGKLLQEAGLGDDRLLVELEARLGAKVTKHYQEKSLGDFEDNTTRMRATELLAALLRKTGDYEIMQRLAEVEARLDKMGGKV